MQTGQTLKGETMVQNLLYAVSKPIIGLYGRVLGLNVTRHAPLPPGPKIIVANHPTTSDPFLVAYLTQEHARILIIGHVFEIPAFGSYLRKLGHIPVVPGEGHHAFGTAHAHLSDGGTLIIFPEGALSPGNGGFQTPRTGAARLALLTGAPGIPMGISLSPHGLWHLNSDIGDKSILIRWARRGPYGVTVGRALQFEGDVMDHDYVRGVASRIMKAITELAHESRIRLQARRRPVPYMWPAVPEAAPAG